MSRVGVGRVRAWPVVTIITVHNNHHNKASAAVLFPPRHATAALDVGTNDFIQLIAKLDGCIIIICAVALHIVVRLGCVFRE